MTTYMLCGTSWLSSRDHMRNPHRHWAGLAAHLSLAGGLRVARSRKHPLLYIVRSAAWLDSWHNIHCSRRGRSSPGARCADIGLRVARQGHSAYHTVRGGAFDRHQRDVRCACRGRFNLVNCYWGMGFRVAKPEQSIFRVLCSGSFANCRSYGHSTSHFRNGPLFRYYTVGLRTMRRQYDSLS